MSLLNKSTAVRTCVLPEVYDIIKNIKPDFDSVNHYSTNIIEWLKPVIDLSDFNVYPTNGITQGLDLWMAKENRGIYMEKGDYQWVRETGSGVKYISTPSAIDGNWINVPPLVPVALDIAYVGSTAIKKIEINKNIDHVFFSLSKPFGIRNVRTGWYFSRKPDENLEALTYSAKYYNYYANEVAETIINNFDIDYIHSKLHPYQRKICDELNFVASDSVWLATTTDIKYNKFKRGGVNRVCISEEISAAYAG